MKLHIIDFRHNSPMSVSDILKDVFVAKDSDGTIRVRFIVKDKYYEVDAGWYHGPEMKGSSIVFMPYIYDKDENGELVTLEPYGELVEEYYEHKDWFRLHCVLGSDDYYEYRVIPLRHEYLWVLTPVKTLYDFSDMTPLEIVIDEEEEQQ